MKIVVIDGVEYEFSDNGVVPPGFSIVAIRPLPPKQKTIVKVAANATMMSEEKYRYEYENTCAIWDYIEQRLQALEKKVEGK